MKDTAVETIIGAIVIAIAAAFFLFAYQLSGKASATGGSASGRLKRGVSRSARLCGRATRRPG